MAELRDAGALGFTDDGKPVVSAGTLRKALQYQRLCGGVVALHEEDPALSRDGVMHEGAVSARLGIAGIPSLSESTMVARDAALAGYEDARVHFQHLSCVESVEALEQAKEKGIRVSAEVCPHHLTLTDDMVRTLDSRFKMNPPLRAESDRRALVEALRTGLIDCVATDHAPHASHEKEVPFEQAPMGTTGLETAFAALYTELVHARRARPRVDRRADERRRGAVRPAGAADRARPARQPVPGRPRGPVRGRRRRLRQPLEQLLLPRPDAPGPGAADARRRRGRVPGADAGRDPGSPLTTEATAYVLLEDGARFDGLACGAHAHAVGEIVFTTSMSGYQEAMTDPSYAGQLITFTYPQIGNYGVSAAAMESDRRARAGGDHARGGRPRRRPGRRQRVADLAARQRDPGDHRPRHARARPPHPRPGRDARRGVPGGALRATGARADRRRAADGRPRPRAGRHSEAANRRGRRQRRASDRDDRHRRQALDRPEPAASAARPSSCTRAPRPPNELLQNDPDAIFLANGPGDPAALGYIVDTVRQLVGKRPVYGICLGHQLLCRAVGLETYKLPFGHHGANHPVKDLTTGAVEITSQNHGFAVLGPDGAKTIDRDEAVRWETDFGAAELTHINLYDRTVEGLALRDVQGATVQYHPEAGPGPHDALHLFDRFVEADPQCRVGTTSTRSC